MSASPLDRLRDAAIRVQLPVVLVTVPITTGLYALAVVPWVNDIVLEQAGVTAAAAATRATWIAVGTLLGCVLLATTFAAMLLRGSIRAAVGRLQGATDAIARGEFRHRIRSERRDELGQLAASTSSRNPCASAATIKGASLGPAPTIAVGSHSAQTRLQTLAMSAST